MRLTLVTVLALVAVACEPAYAEGTLSRMGAVDPAVMKARATRYVTPGASVDTIRSKVVDADAMKQAASRTIADSPKPNVNVVEPGTGNFKSMPFEATYKPIPLDQVLKFKPKPRGFNRSVFSGHKSVRGQGGVTKVRGQE